MQETTSDVLAQIRAAFPAVPLHLEGATTGELDGDVFGAHVEGKTWEQLDRALLIRRCSVLSFLATHHIVDVLPAYLCAFVEQGTRTQLPDTLLPTLNRKSKRRFAELVAALTPAQRAAVVAALEEFAATESESGQPAEAARAALERWNTYPSISPSSAGP